MNQTTGDTLWKLLGITPPDGASLGAWQWELSWVSFVVWFLITSAGVAFAIRLYRRESAGVTPKLGTFLVTLRAFSMAALAWLVCVPLSCSVGLVGTRPRPVAVILDSSKSMATADERLKSEEQIRIRELGVGQKPQRRDVGVALLESATGDLAKKLAEKHPVHWYLAGDKLSILGATEANAAAKPWTAWQTTSSRSELGRAITDLLATDDPPSAIVMLTDGRQTPLSLPGSGPDLIAACTLAASKGVPVHLLGVGATEPPKLEIRDLDCPEILQSGERVLVRMRWRVSGLDPADASTRIEISLELDGTEVAREEVSPSSGSTDNQRSVLAFRVPPLATPKPFSALKAKARFVRSAFPSAASSLERQVRLTNRPVRILLVDSVPRWDYRFLMMQLAREGPQETASPQGSPPPLATSQGVSVAPSFLILGADGDLASREPFVSVFPTREELFRYDAVLLGDVDPAKLGPDAAETIRRFVEEGGGLMIQSGRTANPMSWINTPLADLLPVEPDRNPPKADLLKDPFLPTPTPEGLATDAFRLADTPEETAAVYAKLVGMIWHTPVSKLKPGARALLAHPTLRCATGPVPLMATQSYGRGRVAWLGVDETWRWRYNAAEVHFARFWMQWLLWSAASRSEAPRRIRLAIDRRDPPSGTTGEIRARLLDSSFAPDTRTSLPARIEKVLAGPGLPGAEGDKEVVLKAVQGQPGEFSLGMVHDKPGRYRIRIPGDDGPGLEWTVFSPLDPELSGGLAEEFLREAAVASGGSYFSEGDAQKLPETIPPKTRPWSVVTGIPRLHPIFFIVLVLALGTEWTLRRRNQLS